MIFGPHYLGGAGFFHLYDEQGYGQIKLFMKSWRSPETLQGKLLRVSMAWAQYGAGIGVPLLEDTTTRLPHLESETIRSMREYLASVGGTIELQGDFVVARQRAQDDFIMDVAVASRRFRPAELKRINYCRLYLNVLLVSDIATAKGDYIDAMMYTGEANPVTTKHRVNQAKPNTKAWSQWRRLLLMITHNSPRLKLKKPLGQWLVPWFEMRCQWPFLYDPTTDHLFHYSPQGYTQHNKLRQDYDRTPAHAIETPVISRRAVPVNVIKYDHTFRIQWGWQQSGAPQDQVVAPMESFYDLLPTMEPWEWQLLFDVEIHGTEQDLWKELTHEACVIASDGSASDGKGSFAWVISGADGSILAECKGPVYGAKVTSFRAEGYGILSVLRFLIGMTKVHGEAVPSKGSPSPQDETPFLGKLQERVLQYQLQVEALNAQLDHNHTSIRQHYMVCDNQSMVNKTNEISQYITMYPNSTMASEYDVLAEIRTAMRHLGVSQPELHHIKGHQDETKSWQELSHTAKMNCKADDLADQYMQEFHDVDRSRVSILPTSGCQLHLAAGTITYNLKLNLTHARTVPPLRQKLCKRNAWNEPVFNDIDWTAHGQAQKRLKKHKKTLVQYVNDWLPVGKRVHKYDPKYPEWCPSCTAQVEDMSHLLACPSTSRESWRKDCLATIKKTLDETNMAHPIKSLLVEGLHAALYNQPAEAIAVEPAVADVAASQTAIGWTQLLKGRMTKKWAATQERHLGP